MRRNALSLVEIIVVIAILGILIAILLPAVMAARESARRVECANKLKQIGLGIQNHVTKAGVLPIGSLSAHALLLPYLEQGNLYNTINFEIQDIASPVNETARSTTVAAFLCPSDTRYRDVKPGATNYAANIGVGLDKDLNPLLNAPFSPRVIRLADIVDGTSSTAAFAEWCIGPGGPLEERDLGSIYKNTYGGNIEAFATTCHGLDPAKADWGGRLGGGWLEVAYGNNYYNHLLPPGDHSCVDSNGSAAGGWTASSRHVGGASTLFLDGHVSFIKGSISRAHWRGLGTISGGEVTSEID